MSTSKPLEASEGTESGREASHELPPSAKLVAKTLEYNGRLTQRQLAEKTRLPQRTVRSALSRLEEAGFVPSEISFVDGLKHIYELDI